MGHFYLPALRATSFQKEASKGALRDDFLCRLSFAWRLTVVSRPYGSKTPVRLRSRRGARAPITT